MSDPLRSRPQALARELRKVIGRLGRRLKAQTAPGALPWAQVQVLGHLDRDGLMTTSALARAEGVRPQSMSATVAAMEAAKLVKSSPDRNDGRQTIITLTEAGRRALKDNRIAREDWLSDTLHGTFTRAELGELAHAIELLGRLAREGE